MIPGNPSLTMHQSWPGVRRRRDSQPSIHLPRSVYFSGMKIAGSGFSRFSFGAKKSSLVATASAPRRADARSIRWVNSLMVAFTIHEAAAHVRLAHPAFQRAPRIGRALVPLPQAGGVDDHVRVRIPCDQVGIHAFRDPAGPPVEPGE